MKHNLDVTEKELVLLYLLLKERDCPDEPARARFLSRVEKIIYEFMTIEEVEHIDDFYRSLR
jgi:hypothetical protein